MIKDWSIKFFSLDNFVMLYFSIITVWFFYLERKELTLLLADVSYMTLLLHWLNISLIMGIFFYGFIIIFKFGGVFKWSDFKNIIWKIILASAFSPFFLIAILDIAIRNHYPMLNIAFYIGAFVCLLLFFIDSYKRFKALV